jgi:hypothetical protein
VVEFNRVVDLQRERIVHLVQRCPDRLGRCGPRRSRGADGDIPVDGADLRHNAVDLAGVERVVGPVGGVDQGLLGELEEGVEVAVDAVKFHVGFGQRDADLVEPVLQADQPAGELGVQCLVAVLGGP